MNISPKYEDVVAQLETERARVTDYIAQRAQTELQLGAAMARESALREELEESEEESASLREVIRDIKNWREVSQSSTVLSSLLSRADEIAHKPGALQQRLTVAEHRAGELEAAAREMLRIAGIANQGSNAYSRAIINLDAALKPAAEPHKCIECESQYCHGVCVERGDDDECYKGAEGEGS